MPKLKNAIFAWTTIRDAAARFGTGYAFLTRRFIYLYRNRHFSPYEIHFNDLLNPRISEKALERYMSFHELIGFDKQHTLNAYLCLTMDKAVFYAVCSTAGVPIPELLAVFDQPSIWLPDGRLLRSRADWCAFSQSLPQEFIVKPALGLQGRGLTAFHREGDAYVDHESGRFSHDELYDFLCGQKEQNLFASGYSHHSLRLPQASHKLIVQERIYAHSDIRNLTGSASLCTARLFTHCDRSGRIHLIGSAIRLVNGDNVVDNLDRGVRGNLWCSVDPESGCITEAFVRPQGSDRLELSAKHPSSGMDIVGFRIPHWNEVVALAQRLAHIFRPQPSITWDIGIADKGPVVIEGNICGQLLPTPLNIAVGALPS